jgi:tRNA 2-selenouridine synthase
MPAQIISINDFLEKAQHVPVLDVRSPAEYLHAHIPGAVSLPLFTDEERKIVGTTYKQVSREEAIKIGLDYFGPKMRQMVEQVELLLKDSAHKTVLVHCWRGGMRSAGVAWLLDLYGFQVFTLQGGYKSFRNWVLNQFDLPYPFQILGGYTGSGKTEILLELQRAGEVVIDLEHLAGHKGSTFGNLGLPPQPSVEMFENKLALELKRALIASKSKANASIWIEDESQRIGRINMPNSFFAHFKQCPVLFIDIPFEERLTYVVKMYGRFEVEQLMHGVFRIRKRLGGLDAKNAIQYLLEQDIQGCFRILLSYYDRFYNKSNKVSEGSITLISLENTNHKQNAKTLLAWKAANNQQFA